jgi:dTDP-3-amino-3,4,6-trideoxy-alpha-D-glucose transaminase
MSIPFYDLAAVHRELGDDIAGAIGRVLKSNRLILGPECEAFEVEFARYCGVEHAIGVGNGLDALKLALLALGVRPGDEVVVPGQTFIATWLAVSAIGATPVPVDVRAEDGQIDPEAVAAAITSRTAAVVAVHLFGTMAPMRELHSLCVGAGLALVEDAAQGHGAELGGLRAGAWSDAAAFSIYPGKNLGALGDAGMAVTPHAEVADRIRLLRNYGSRRKYEHEALGGNSRLDEVQAAVLRVKLPLLDGWNATRRGLAQRYFDGLSDTPAIMFARSEPDSLAVHHLLPVLVDQRDAVRRRLAATGIETGVHYPSTPARTGAYTEQFGSLHLPHSELWARDELSLPIGPSMDVTQVDAVVRHLTAALADLPTRTLPGKGVLTR